MLRSWKPGQVCCRCWHEVDPSVDRLDADHNDNGIGYMGLSHSSPCRICGQKCNQVAGGNRSALLAGKQLRDRRCKICGKPFTAAHGYPDQATCGQRECITKLRAIRHARRDDPEPPPVSGRAW
jgi:hypothetical protein